MSQPQQMESSPQHSLSTSAAVQSSVDGLPEWCTNEFRERYRRGEVPLFGCYDPVYLRQPFRPASESAGLLPPSSSFFPPFSSLVRRFASASDAASSTAPEAKDDGEQDANGDVAGSGFGRARPAHSWEHITSAEDLWNGPPLTTKIPPAGDYERILLDRP
ncbi:unspecified product [Leptomonas pyrrhocoris]|uniref:Unspecified product n=1 Tax=Leptomonas pyrrhocoris TaxID=157538 RepID=A0A0M9G312_LEPPY|nr:unspecified product [Leptomonas pyrrhocoris]KPA81116.1 unspecified product [Leptomonas pyrrhocoris]|eukprot:XP_015659555.1 unspecified product [Leptomonas pyrrhocoris]